MCYDSLLHTERKKDHWLRCSRERSFGRPMGDEPTLRQCTSYLKNSSTQSYLNCCPPSAVFARSFTCVTRCGSLFFAVNLIHWQGQLGHILLKLMASRDMNPNILYLVFPKNHLYECVLHTLLVCTKMKNSPDVDDNRTSAFQIKSTDANGD